MVWLGGAWPCKNITLGTEGDEGQPLKKLAH